MPDAGQLAVGQNGAATPKNLFWIEGRCDHPWAPDHISLLGGSARFPLAGKSAQREMRVGVPRALRSSSTEAGTCLCNTKNFPFLGTPLEQLTWSRWMSSP